MTTEFHRDFQVQTSKMLRPRFMGFLTCFGLIYLLIALATVGAVAVALLGSYPGGDAFQSQLISHFRWGRFGIGTTIGLMLVDIGFYGWCWYRVLRRPMGREEMVRFTQWYFALRGTIDIATAFLADASSYPAFPWWLLMYHVMACLFLPWSPTQAMRPIGLLLVMNALCILVFRDAGPAGKAIAMVFSLFAAAPGVGIAALKQSRRMQNFRVQMLQSRYGEMRRELYDARRIHESLFPPAILTGPIRLDYRYEPMRQIGGDYLYARHAPCARGGHGRFNLLVLDVTGHGIAAALTVNRLYGEVERLFAENPDTGPGEVLSALNRYVNLTLANHSVFATALCVRVDIDQGHLEYASGGHPPAFVCTADGRMEELNSTSFVLGACAGADFDPCVQRMRFEAGDTLIAYTDGAIEARNDVGRMLGVQGLVRVLVSLMKGRPSSADGSAYAGMAATLLSAVESFRLGPPEDDTLVVELHRPVLAGVDPRGERPLAGLGANAHPAAGDDDRTERHAHVGI